MIPISDEKSRIVYVCLTIKLVYKYSQKVYKRRVDITYDYREIALVTEIHDL